MSNAVGVENVLSTNVKLLNSIEKVPPPSLSTPISTITPPISPVPSIVSKSNKMVTASITNTASPFIFKLYGGPETLRRVLLSLGWIEWSADFHTEHYYNLMWRSGHFRLSEMLGATHLQRVNHFSKSGVITNKGKLLRAHRKARSVFGKTYDFVPTSFLLPTEYTKFVKCYSEQAMNDEKKIWICKPDNSACGRKIFLIRDLSDLKYDQQVVVQSYIERPLTIGGYKVDLRLYVLVKSFRPLQCYLYKDGLARFGTQKYTKDVDLNNLYAHLTNTSINKFSTTCKTNKDVIGAGCKWDFVQLREWAVKTTGIDWDYLWSRIRHTIIMSLLLAVPVVRQEPQCFEMFGFDIIVDDKLKPWLLEVNCSPALNMDEPTDRRVKPKLLADTMLVLKHQEISPSKLKEASLKDRVQRNSMEKQSSKRMRKVSQVSKVNTSKRYTNGSGIGSRRLSKQTSTKTKETTENQSKMLKHMDFSMSDIGNYEKLYPFNDQTIKMANAVTGVTDSMEMQEKIKDIVDHMKSFEKQLITQQRQEMKMKIKKNSNKSSNQMKSMTRAQEDQVAAAAKMLQ